VAKPTILLCVGNAVWTLNSDWTLDSVNKL